MSQSKNLSLLITTKLKNSLIKISGKFVKRTESGERIKKLNKTTGMDIFVWILILLLVSFSLLPLVYLISTAFKPIDEILLFPPTFFVKQPTLRNLATLMTALSSSVVPFTRYIFNSFTVTVVTVVGTVIISALGAYGLVIHNPKGSGTIMKIVIIALMFSPFVTQIPNYLVVVNMGLYNNFFALILPRLAVAYNFFLMERFTRQVPFVIIEAARIDGASELRVFWRLVMPILKPAWATLVVLSFVSSWNDAFSPLVFINSQAMKTLPLAMQTIAGGTGTSDLGRAGAVMAANFLLAVPPIIIYIFMQRKVMQTMAFSGIKA